MLAVHTVHWPYPWQSFKAIPCRHIPHAGSFEMQLVEASGTGTSPAPSAHEVPICLTSVKVTIEGTGCKVALESFSAGSVFVPALWASQANYKQLQECPKKSADAAKAAAATADATGIHAALLSSIKNFVYGGDKNSMTGTPWIEVSGGVVTVQSAIGAGPVYKFVYAITQVGHWRSGRPFWGAQWSAGLSYMGCTNLHIQLHFKVEISRTPCCFPFPPQASLAGAVTGVQPVSSSTSFTESNAKMAVLGDSCATGRFGIIVADETTGDELKLCPLCPAGTSGNGNGCTACTKGTVASSIGATTCSGTCPKGEYAQEGEARNGCCLPPFDRPRCPEHAVHLLS